MLARLAVHSRYHHAAYRAVDSLHLPARVIDTPNESMPDVGWGPGKDLLLTAVSIFDRKSTFCATGDHQCLVEHKCDAHRLWPRQPLAKLPLCPVHAMIGSHSFVLINQSHGLNLMLGRPTSALSAKPPSTQTGNGWMSADDESNRPTPVDHRRFWIQHPSLRTWQISFLTKALTRVPTTGGDKSSVSRVCRSLRLQTCQSCKDDKMSDGFNSVGVKTAACNGGSMISHETILLYRRLPPVYFLTSTLFGAKANI
nr:hypothetical protein CFP56_58813 [Quercus suber]